VQRDRPSRPQFSRQLALQVFEGTTAASFARLPAIRINPEENATKLFSRYSLILRQFGVELLKNREIY
jgi:hypothetical protein